MKVFDQRKIFIQQVAGLPEFQELAPRLGDLIAEACFKRFCASAIAQKMEIALGVALCLGVALGLSIGLLWRGPIAALFIMVPIVFSITGLYAVLVRIVWWRWLKRFVTSEEFKALITNFD